MTTGHYIIDHTLHAPPNLVGVGHFEEKSWSGSNQPGRNPEGPHPRKRMGEWIVLKDGSKVFVTYRVPHFRPPKRKKWDAHPYVMDLQVRNEAAVTGSFGTGGSGTFAPRGAWSVNPLLDANDQIKLVNKLREKLQGSDFNAAIFVAEFGESMRMIGDTAIRLAKVLFHLKRGDLIGASRSLFEGASRKPLARHDWQKMKPGVATAKQTATWWLEVQYGWRPLLQDVQGAAEMVAHACSVPFSQTYRTSVRKVEEYILSWDFPGNYGCKRECYRVHRRGVIAKIVETQSTLAQLGLLDPLTVAWELLPFSFVADWFIPIGQWIEARGNAGRLSGEFVITDKYIAVSGPLLVDYGLTSPDPDDDVWKNIALSRTVSSSLSVPMPNFKPLKKALGWEHCANGIALLVAGRNPYHK